MKQAIITKHLGPTNSRGSRIRAHARSMGYGDKIVTVSAMADWDYGSSVEENHARAAKLLATRLGWAGLWIAGGSPENTGEVFVCIPTDGGMQSFNLGTEGRDWFHVAAKPA